MQPSVRPGPPGGSQMSSSAGKGEGKMAGKEGKFAGKGEGKPDWKGKGEGKCPGKGEKGLGKLDGKEGPGAEGGQPRQAGPGPGPGATNPGGMVRPESPGGGGGAGTRGVPGGPTPSRPSREGSQREGGTPPAAPLARGSSGASGGGTSGTYAGMPPQGLGGRPGPGDGGAGGGGGGLGGPSASSAQAPTLPGPSRPSGQSAPAAAATAARAQAQPQAQPQAQAQAHAQPQRPDFGTGRAPHDGHGLGQGPGPSRSTPAERDRFSGDRGSPERDRFNSGDRLRSPAASPSPSRRGAPAGMMSPEQLQLEETHEEVLRQRRELDKKDRHIHQNVDSLIQTLQRRTIEAESQYRELEGYVRIHGSPPAGGGVGDFGMEGDEGEGDGSPSGLTAMKRAMREAQRRLEERLAEAEMSNAELISAEEHAAMTAAQELTEVAAAVAQMKEERDIELRALELAREELDAEELVRRRQSESIESEIRAQAAESEALQDQREGLEAKVRTLQQEVHRVVYLVGQKDQELANKNSEIQDVRKSLVAIQNEMDEVNRELDVRCDQVQAVENNVRPSRDLGEKARILRQMVQETHGSMDHLCSLLEEERARKAECEEGLRQQKVRTELLLQLLQHFKNRTTHLSPEALLTRSLGSSSSFTAAGTATSPNLRTATGAAAAALGSSDATTFQG